MPLIWRRKREPLNALIAALQRDGRDGRLVALERLPRTEPTFAEPRTPLPAGLGRALANAGVARLYAHQAETLDRIAAGEDVALVAPTAGGKTLAFALPLLDRLAREPGAKALCVYPTNALIHDQERALRRLFEWLPWRPRVATLTGATTPEERRQLRAAPPAVLLTNPEMLHLSVVGAGGWAGLLSGLRLLVIDEAHSYRGLFGAHMALTVRRLLRSCAGLGATPRIVVCTATVGNPLELAETLTGRDCTLVHGSGAARGSRTFAVWQSHDGGRRAGDAEGEAVAVLCAAVRAGLGTILFTLTRRGAENAAARARAALGPSLAPKVAPYRSGYAPAQRRELEEKLRDGRLCGVIATNALEVGIDVGGLDVAIVAGFPGSRTALWQQLGRAGRGERPSLGVFVPYPRAVDGYYAAHPGDLRSERFEDAAIDLGNAHVAGAHLVCAAAEAPLRDEELPLFGPAARIGLEDALSAGRLKRSGERYLATDPRPHAAVSLRGGAGESFSMFSAGKAIGTLDAVHLGLEAYPGATYLHAGERFRVLSVDLTRRAVELTHDGDAAETLPIVQTVVQIAERRPEQATATLRVRTTTTGFQRRGPGRSRGEPIPLAEPLRHDFVTEGFWLLLADERRAAIERRDGAAFLAGLHALEHLLPSAVALLCACDARDVLATAVADHGALGGAAVFLYDACEGGAGIAARVRRRNAELLRLAEAIVAGCRCRDGCPRCVLSGICWRQHTGQEKRVARELIGGLQ